MEGNAIALDDDGYVHDRNTRIIGSSSAIVSLISSSALIWMIKRSRASLTTTYHRILLGMAIADIFLSLGLAHFNLTAPSEGSYYVWNASGNQLSCSIQGFVASVGAASGVLYSVSLNLYSLAVVKYRKPDSYIRSKVEPFLHGVPILYTLLANIPLLVGKNFNEGGGGNCYAPIYRPPHCEGYEDGQIPEGFDIPCGRGHNGAVRFYYSSFFVTLFIVPLTIGTSLGVIYRSVKKQENTIAGYGASNFTDSAQQPDRSNSRVVLHRALAYSISYLLTWSFLIIGAGLDMANVEWPITLWYLVNIFNPLQGFSNFLIFVYPKLMRAKSRGGDNMTWFQAFKTIFLGKETNHAISRRRGNPPERTPQAHIKGEVTLKTKDETAQQLGEENSENLGKKRQQYDNDHASTADDDDDGYKEFLAVVNAPSPPAASDPEHP